MKTRRSNLRLCTSCGHPELAHYHGGGCEECGCSDWRDGRTLGCVFWTTLMLLVAIVAFLARCRS